MIYSAKPDLTPEMRNPHGVSARKLLDREYAQAVHLSLAPGQSLIPHATATDVIFYVLEGEGVVDIGGESLEVTADTLVESPARAPHCLRNTGGGNFRGLVLKTPRPAEPTVFLK